MRDPVWLETNQPNLVQHQKARLFSPDAFKTSKYQNLPMYHFQKWLGFAIFCDFDTCHKEITIDSLIGSPCIRKTWLFASTQGCPETLETLDKEIVVLLEKRKV